jgi:hypothetical protein
LAWQQSPVPGQSATPQSSMALAKLERSTRVAKLGQPKEQWVTTPMISSLRINPEPELPPRRSTLNSYQVDPTKVIVPLEVCWRCELTQVLSTP